MTLDISLPEEFLQFFDGSQHELERTNRLVLAIELYLAEKVSIGKAAELSGLAFDEFHTELRKRQLKRVGGPVTRDEAETEYQDLQAHLNKEE